MSYLCYFATRFSGLVGALGSLGAGYNGLPSVMSGLDDSLSDITPRKKYPFELEKAIHNVMFIQHHMQRQDEFNAVSFPDIHKFERGTENARLPRGTDHIKRITEMRIRFRIVGVNQMRKTTLSGRGDLWNIWAIV